MLERQVEYLTAQILLICEVFICLEISVNEILILKIIQNKNILYRSQGGTLTNHSWITSNYLYMPSKHKMWSLTQHRVARLLITKGWTKDWLFLSFLEFAECDCLPPYELEHRLNTGIIRSLPNDFPRLLSVSSQCTVWKIKIHRLPYKPRIVS